MVDHPSANGVKERIDDEGRMAAKFRRNLRHGNHADAWPRARVPREVGDRPDQPAARLGVGAACRETAVPEASRIPRAPMSQLRPSLGEIQQRELSAIRQIYISPMSRGRAKDSP
jgi:hypothetical protein